ncbi:MAG: hypothetical protein ACK5LC_08770 [Coprobacillaceae bacterium]
MISFFDSSYNRGMIQEMQITNFKKMIKENEFVHLSGNVLILTDRLCKLGKELSLYIKNNTNANTKGVVSTIEDINVSSFEKTNIDYLIIVGYLENTEGYKVIDILRSLNRNIKTVQWALLDDYISTIEMKYKISFKFDRLQPPKEFINYLSEIKNKSDRECNL